MIKHFQLDTYPVMLFVGSKTLGNFVKMLIDWFQTSSVQTFQTLIPIYRKGNFIIGDIYQCIAFCRIP